MGLLIPVRESPGKDIDVFLEPLVEELVETLCKYRGSSE